MKRATSSVNALVGLALAVLAGASGAPLDAQRPATFVADQIPMADGVTLVQAVSGDQKQGDYEATLTVLPASANGVRIQSRAFVIGDNGVRQWLFITRRVQRDDLLNAPLQILGFDTKDSEVIRGATAIGPSLAVVRDLVRQGRASHVVRNYASRRDNTGTLERVETIAFPLLVNGERVTVAALVARGQLGIPSSMRPWELQILDHPVHPITLKVSYGAEGAAVGSPAEWSRQVVRIDFAGAPSAGAGGGRASAAAGAQARVAEQLTDDCRARVPGIYFEFDSDQLNPASEPALRGIADLMRKNAAWTVEIEGHTDNVGGPRYNLDLSNRRAASVKRALVDQHAIATARLSTRGFGLTRPVETNETVEGRAMNRRVELVRPCKGKPE
jgi:outer membrane protein OmpA-like peptidoglycan-associated protein